MASRFAFLLAVLILLTSSLGAGQSSTSPGATSEESSPRVQLFGGYSLLRPDTGGLNRATLDTALNAPAGTFGSASMFSGWDSQLQFNVTRLLGIVADFGGNYGRLFAASSSSGVTGLPRSQTYSLLVGPVVTFHSGKLESFLHGLFGANRLTNASTTTLTGLRVTSLPSSTNTAFAAAVGAGVDFNVWRRIGVRAAQIDYLWTGHDMNAFGNQIFQGGTFVGLAKHESNLQLSTGLTFRF